MNQVGDRDLHLDVFNQHFYRGEPAQFLRSKLNLWLLLATKCDEIDQLMADGLEYAGLKITPQPDRDDDEEALRQFLTLDALQLQHHAAETVLRLFVAHILQPACPWIDLASRTNFRDFKRLVAEQIIDRAPTTGDIGSVFLGRRNSPDEAIDTWHAATANTGLFLQQMAHTFIDDALIYNSIKHGIGAQAGSAHLQVADVVLSRGASISYPTNKRDATGRDWSVTTKWVSPEAAIRQVAVATDMIDSLWTIGRARCLPDIYPAEGADLFYPVSLSPADIADKNPSPTRAMSWKLVREQATQAP